MSASKKEIARLEEKLANYQAELPTLNAADQIVQRKSISDTELRLLKAQTAWAKKVIRVANRKAKKAALKEVDPITPKAPKKAKIKPLQDPTPPVVIETPTVVITATSDKPLNAHGRKMAKSALAKHMAAFKAGDVPEVDPKELF
jgi:hypothetical protein